MESLTYLGGAARPYAGGAPQQRQAGESAAGAVQGLLGSASTAVNKGRQTKCGSPLLIHRAELAPALEDPYTQIRRIRFSRRRRAAAWLIAETREKAGLPPYTHDKGEQETWIKPPRLARCSWRIGPLVRVQGNQVGRANFSSIETCASPWACAVCGPVIRAERAREIGEAYEKSTTKGWSGLFLTLTLRHSQEMPLQETLSLLLEAWRKITGRRDFKKFKEKIGFKGSIKSLEITHGISGWHPHLHLYLIGSEKISPEILAELHQELFSLWQNQIVRLGKTSQIPTTAGFDLKPVTGAGIGRYLAKVGGKLGAELARGDMKKGRAETSRSPLELLDSTSLKDRNLFLEFYHSTKGRGSIVFSRGLRKLLELEPEKDAETLLEEMDETEEEELFFLIEGKKYDRLRVTPGALVRVLEEAEKNWIEAQKRYGWHLEALPPDSGARNHLSLQGVKGGVAERSDPLLL